VERVLPLKGSRNLRDLGGYRTEDGRRVRWRRLYRSGVMSYLTESDRAYLSGLGIRTICDMRTLYERQREPNAWQADGVIHVHWDYDPERVNLRGLLNRENFNADDARAAMLHLYRSIPAAFCEQYAEIFRKLSQNELPMIFNCSAGKDRTGVAAALILTSLGVPPDQVIADFVLTDTAVDLEKALFQHRNGSIGMGNAAYLASVDHSCREPLLKAHPDYLLAALDQIVRDHGSITSYLRSQLGVTNDMLRRVRGFLLEDGGDEPLV
jgi:protein-tyrosine phosphatase